MENPGSMINVTVIWRRNKYVVEMDSEASIKDLGGELQKLTDVKPDTLRLIVPQLSGKGSKLLLPFSDDHSGLTLREASVVEGKHIRMMGVYEDEVDWVLQNSKVDLRIAGFDEEEKRMRQRISGGSHTLFKLPQGPYIFCDFRTLEIPGIELNPPASEALKRMHMLASDPGIVAIMSKHRWRVGIMTELAPVGYVGVSPKCILGFNKNHGEEISLRLRTDDLKGFRKYESIRKTLLHELAHMVYSEHDANFYALDKQLNQEANSLDWTKSRGRTLGGFGHSDDIDEDLNVTDSRSFGHRLGGNVSDQLASARASSVLAAYHRLANASHGMSGASEIHEEPDPDDSSHQKQGEPYSTGVERESMDAHILDKIQLNKCEPDPDESQDKVVDESVPDNVGHKQDHLEEQVHLDKHHRVEPDPDDSQENKVEPDPDESMADRVEPDPDDSRENNVEPDPDESIADRVEPDPDDSREYKVEPDPDDSREYRVEPDPDEYRASLSQQANANHADLLSSSQGMSSMQVNGTIPDDQELERIQDPVSFVCQRLQKAVGMLRAEVNSVEATAILQTLFKIIRNVIEHPNELKYKRLRKANPIIQRQVANRKAAMEIMQVVGFSEDVIVDETGKAETYLVLKRNDPGLLWLTKSTIEPYLVY